MNYTSSISGSNPVKPKLVNHVIFLIDSSSSMGGRLKLVKEVFDSTLQMLKDTQTDNQDINISLYQFGTDVKRLIFNKNINELNTNISFTANGMTALRDAINISIGDHEQIDISKDDHSFLIYAITDGADNHSRINPAGLKQKINSLNDIWTVAALVPGLSEVSFAKSSGIPAGNIQIWDINGSSGFKEVGNSIASSYQTYNTNRSVGIRSSSNIFAVNSENITRSNLKTVLTEVKGSLHHAQKDYVIKDMVEQYTGAPYVKGSTFYELSKTELVQDYKEIVIISKKDDKRFGGNGARDILGLPYSEVKIKPGNFGDWRIFVQSTSINRKIKSGTSIFIKS